MLKGVLQAVLQLSIALQAGIVGGVVGAGRQLGEHCPLGDHLLPVHQLCPGLLLWTYLPPCSAFQLLSSGE